MRFAQGCLIAAFLAVVSPAAASQYDTLAFEAGPALAGTGTAWADAFGENMFVRRAPAGGAVSTLYSVKRLAMCDQVSDLAASAELVAIQVRRTGDENSNCNTIGLEHWVGGPGEARRLDADGCGDAAIDVDGGLVAIARASCRPASIVIHDVRAGTSSSPGFVLAENHSVHAVRLAGRYVAVSMGVMGGSTAQVVVWDRELDKEAYRVDGGQLFDKLSDAVAAHIELASDGRLLVGAQTFGSGWGSVRYGWASVGEPALHRIPGTYDMPSGRFAFAGDLMAVPIAYEKGESVIGFDGAVKNPFNTAPIRESVDFDGSRIAWADQGHVYNEAYPYTPPPAQPTFGGGPVTPQPTVAGASVPAARVSVKAVVKAEALRAFSGTAADADGDLSLVRVGLVRSAGRRCWTLQRSGRMKASKRVGGRCAPFAFLDARGTAAWKLKLRRRLPAGRYTIYVQAVDAAGHAQLAFTEAAGNLRTFRVR
jgi:hypothetical protein